MRTESEEKPVWRKARPPGEWTARSIRSSDARADNDRGIILPTAFINLLIGSASSKWALLAPTFVPMLMQLGNSPELTQAAYRIGDSTTNIITPSMPYFPLVVVFGQRYVKSTGIGRWCL